jgi:hypothetical protein
MRSVIFTVWKNFLSQAVDRMQTLVLLHGYSFSDQTFKYKSYYYRWNTATFLSLDAAACCCRFGPSLDYQDSILKLGKMQIHLYSLRGIPQVNNNYVLG